MRRETYKIEGEPRDFWFERSGQLPIRCRGWLIAYGDTVQPDLSFWLEVQIVKTVSGRYVVAATVHHQLPPSDYLAYSGPTAQDAINRMLQAISWPDWKEFLVRLACEAGIVEEVA